MASSRSSGRGYRRRMNKKLKLAAHKTTSSKPPNISSSSATRPEPRRDRPRMEPTDKDLESDEAVWELYKRWCIHLKMHRTPEQMQMRFIYFKKRAIEVFENNVKYKNKQSSYRRVLFKF